MVIFLTFNPKEPQGNDEISTLPVSTSTGTMEILEGRSDGHSFFFLALLYISYSLVGVVVYWLCYMKTILMCNFNKYPKVFTVLIPYALIYRYRSIKICPQSAKLHQVTTQYTATCIVNQMEEKLTHQMAPLPQVSDRCILNNKLREDPSSSVAHH